MPDPDTSAMNSEKPSSPSFGPYASMRLAAFSEKNPEQKTAAFTKLEQTARDAQEIVGSLIEAKVQAAIDGLPLERLNNKVAIAEAIRNQAQNPLLAEDVQKEIDHARQFDTFQGPLSRLSPDLLEDFVEVQMSILGSEVMGAGRVSAKRVDGETPINITAIINERSANISVPEAPQAPPLPAESVNPKPDEPSPLADIARTAGEVVASVAAAEAVDLGQEIAKNLLPEKPNPEPAPVFVPISEKANPDEFNAAKLSVDELQMRIDRAEINSPELKQLRVEKQRRVDYMNAEYQKKYGGPASKPIERLLSEAVSAATPAYYVEPLRSISGQDKSPFTEGKGAYQLNRLFNIVIRDEVNRVIQKIYLGAEQSQTPPVNRADPESLRSITERVNKSRVDAGVDIDNPIDLLGTLPLTFDEWKARNPHYAAEDRIRDAVAAYYAANEPPKQANNQDLKDLLTQLLPQARTGQSVNMSAYERMYSPEFQRNAYLELEEDGFKVEIPPLTSLFYEGLSDAEKKFWENRITLNNARSIKRGITKGEEFSVNSEMINLTVDKLKAITDHPGVSEAMAIYTVMIMNPNRLDAIPALRGARWLGVQTMQEMKNSRKKLRSFMESTFQLTQAQARDAEQVAYNFISASALAEFMDTKNTETKVNEVVNSNIRDVMHPLFKMADTASKGRVWPKSAIGEWVLNHSKGAKSVESVKKMVPEIVNIIPDDMVQSLLHQVKINNRPLLESFQSVGERLLNGTLPEYHVNWIDNDPQARGENPFRGYYFTGPAQASMLYFTLENGVLPSGKSYADLKNALVLLKLNDNRKLKELLAYTLDQKNQGEWIQPRRKNLLPRVSFIDLFTTKTMALAGFWSKFNREHPGFMS
jgi:hypothetical protein